MCRGANVPCSEVEVLLKDAEFELAFTLGNFSRAFELLNELKQLDVDGISFAVKAEKVWRIRFI